MPAAPSPAAHPALTNLFFSQIKITLVPTYFELKGDYRIEFNFLIELERRYRNLYPANFLLSRNKTKNSTAAISTIVAPEAVFQ